MRRGDAGGADAGGEDAGGIQAKGDDDSTQHEPVRPPYLPPCGRARVWRRREAGELERRGGVGEVLGHGRGAAREGGRDAESRAHQGDLGDGEAQERTSGQPSVQGDDRRAPVPPPRGAEYDEEHRLGDDEQAVGREEVGPGGEPRGRGHHSRCPHRDIGPERQRRVAAGHDSEPTSECAVQHDEDDEAADPHRRADEVQPHRVDRCLVVVRRSGVAGQAEHEDAGGCEGSQPGRGHATAGQGSAAGDDDGAARADQADPGRVDLPDEVGELWSERAAGQRQARRVGKRQHHPGQGCDGPDETGDRREPQRRVRRRGRPACRWVDADRAGIAVTAACREDVGDDRCCEDERSERHGRGHVVPDPHERHGPPHERARVLDEDERLHRARRPRRHGAGDQAS